MRIRSGKHLQQSLIMILSMVQAGGVNNCKSFERAVLSSVHRSVGEWFLAFVSVYEFFITLLANLLYGSIPSFKKGIFMANFNMLCNCVLKYSESVLSHWVTKATFLALGLWLLPPRPYAYLQIPILRSRRTGYGSIFASLWLPIGKGARS